LVGDIDSDASGGKLLMVVVLPWLLTLTVLPLLLAWVALQFFIICISDTAIDVVGIVVNLLLLLALLCCCCCWHCIAIVVGIHTAELPFLLL